METVNSQVTQSHDPVMYITDWTCHTVTWLGNVYRLCLAKSHSHMAR